MKTLTVTLAASLAGLALLGSASAQTVWRCGPDANVYSNVPCAGGRSLDVSDLRTADDVRAAKDVVLRERQFAAELVRQRQEREREAQAALGSGMTSVGPASKATPPARLLKVKADAEQPHSVRAAKQRVRKSQPASDAGTSQEARRATRQSQG